jgi:hypothetical protein
LAMLPPAYERFQRFGSFPDGLYLALEHLHPRRRGFPARQVKGLAYALGSDQALIQRVEGLGCFGHGVPLDALASLAGFAAFAGVALTFCKEAFAFGFVLLVLGLLFGSGEFGRLGLVVASCFRWGFDSPGWTKCGPGLGRWYVNRTPQIGIQGDAKEGVKADAEVIGFGACSGVKGVRES